MLTLPEKILFFVAVIVTCYFAWRAIKRLMNIIGRGYDRPDWRILPKRIVTVTPKILTLLPVFQSRLFTSIFHGLVAWGFLFYVLVNAGDVAQGYIPNYVFMGEGNLGNLYRLGSDLLSVSVLIGMTALIIRRYLIHPAALTIREATLLHPKARQGIQRDSTIVGGFIMLHVGARFLGESFHLATIGPDRWQPFASGLASLWSDWSPLTLEILHHAAWWIALGLILVFIPYFPYSKHIHLFFAPLNFLLKPERFSIGQLDPLDFEDEKIEKYGAAHLEDLSWSSFLDAYACIMCNRCQEACPAYETGKALSPSALEINKRYFLNYDGDQLAAGEASSLMLTEFVSTPEAIWACTTCGACSDICPVGNEPMRDILEIRRHLVLMENTFPEQLRAAYRGMERTANPWNIAPEQRLEWADGLVVPTVAENPGAEILWWVGCAPATDPRAQKAARAFARVLNAAEVDFAVLGSEERCTGDAARRSGNEYIFNELASSNVETLNRLTPKRIVTTCPHCLHTLKNEYPAFGGNYDVVHHSQLMLELIEQERLKIKANRLSEKVSFHDPCYLGRLNGVYSEPRKALMSAGIQLNELQRNRAKSFCCGAGGAQMWKEEEQGKERININRIREVQAMEISILTVGCPFCMTMLSDAARDTGDTVQILDVAEIIAE